MKQLTPEQIKEVSGGAGYSDYEGAGAIMAVSGFGSLFAPIGSIAARIAIRSTVGLASPQNFNPVTVNEIWAGDITYLQANEGWMYLAIVMNLFSRRIVGCHIDKCMKSNLIDKALMKAVNLRQPKPWLIFHSDRGSKYTGKLYQRLLATFGIRPSMGDVDACWDVRGLFV